jgi:hypothetical protein
MRIRRYVAPLLRLSLFLFASTLAFAYLDYRAARASVMEHLMGFGQRMAPFMDDGRNTEAPRQLHINGVCVYVAAGRTRHPPSLVRQWYRDRYASHGDGPDELTHNQLSFGDDERGGVAALDFGDHLSLKDLRDRLFRLRRTGDLGALGRLRYVYYEPAGDGGTRFLTVWTDQSFPIGRLLATGAKDAEGSDIDNIPRFPGAVRLLSADEHGRSERIVVYETAAAPPTVALFYRARMRSLGWSLDESFGAAAANEGHSALLFVRPAGHEAVVSLAPHDGDVTTISILQLR